MSYRVPPAPSPFRASRAALLLALLIGLGGCAQMEERHRERLRGDATSMLSNGPPPNYRELVQAAIRQRLSRPDSFVDGLIGSPRPGSQNVVSVVNGRVMESSRRTTAVGWVVCTRYGARSVFGREFQENTAVLISAQGEVTSVDSNAPTCARMPATMMEPLTL
ncbi:hypothetical protein ACVFYP_03775 [Roseomonas sp. F4]